jgi:hypothetical protein
MIGAIKIGVGGSGRGNLAETIRVEVFSLNPALALVVGQQATKNADDGTETDIASIWAVAVTGCDTVDNGLEPMCGGGPEPNVAQATLSAPSGRLKTATWTRMPSFVGCDDAHPGHGRQANLSAPGGRLKTATWTRMPSCGALIIEVVAAGPEVAAKTSEIPRQVVKSKRMMTSGETEREVRV